MQQTISVGVFDWTGFMSTGGYYPADLPQDWKLNYYANDFESACLNLSSLIKQPHLLQEWCEDLDESFQLSLYMDHSNQTELLRLLLQDAIKLQWLIVDTTVVRELERELLTLVNEFSLQPRQIVNRKKLWRPSNSQACVPVALLPQAAEIKTYRGWIEAWIQSCPKAQQVESLTLWLDASVSRYPTLSECRTLVELMGY